MAVYKKGVLESESSLGTISWSELEQISLRNGMIAVIPDFEQEVLEGEVAVKGYARGIIVLILIIRAHPLRLMERLDRS